MNVFCYFQIKQQEDIAFTFNWKDELKTAYPNLTILEADNHSEGFLIQETGKLMHQAQYLICFFDVTENTSLGSVSKLLETLRRSKNNVLIILRGQNEALLKTLHFIKKPTINFQDQEQVMNEIKLFFTS